MSRTLCLLCASLLVAVDLSVAVAHAQALPDAEPPVIDVETIVTGEAGTAQVFTARVVDDRELVDVLLYHRRAGRQAFTALPMQALADTAFYSATVPTESGDLRAIEYYVQARDAGGNRTVSGYAFDPYTRQLSAPTGTIDRIAEAATTPAKPTPTDAPTTIGIGGVPWWQIALGALAVGALAAAAGGSGNGGGQDDGTVPLTINLTEPR